MRLVSSLDPVGCGWAGTWVNFPRNALLECVGHSATALRQQKVHRNLRTTVPPPPIHSRITH
jgi:hypothetical protein